MTSVLDTNTHTLFRSKNVFKRTNNPGNIMSKENMVFGSEQCLYGYSMKINHQLHPRVLLIHQHLFTTFKK